MRIHWVLHEIHFTTTQIRPGFYIYTHERSFCLIVSIIINIRYISRCIIILCSHFGLCQLRWTHWVLYDIHVRTTQIRPGFYIYTLERSFCLIFNIMIDIQQVSRCVIQIFKSIRFILHALLLDYISSSVHVKNLPPTAPQEDAWPRGRFKRLPLNIHKLSWQRAQCHLWEWPRMPHWHRYMAGTVYTPNVTHETHIGSHIHI